MLQRPKKRLIFGVRKQTKTHQNNDINDDHYRENNGLERRRRAFARVPKSPEEFTGEEENDDDGWFFFSNDDDESERENADCVRLWVPPLVPPVPRGRVQPSTVDREPVARDFERFSVGKRTLPTSFGRAQGRFEQRARGV